MVEHPSSAEQRSIDDVNCRLLLASQHVGRLVVPGRVPSVVPLNYVAVDGCSTMLPPRSAPWSRAGPRSTRVERPAADRGLARSVR